MITSYDLHGEFLESCDCFDLCPCWVDDDPDEDHCTGLVVWRLDGTSTVDGSPVGGARVAAVTGHSGARRSQGAITVLFVDRGDCPPATHDLLAAAFRGEAAGPLEALARVTGTVLAARPATITATGPPGEAWALTVTEHDGTTPAVEAAGRAVAFRDPASTTGPGTAPLELAVTALHEELNVRGTAKAQRSETLTVRVPALPGGYVQVRGRSGMRGSFHYGPFPA